jgi:hypothetical protein
MKRFFILFLFFSILSSNSKAQDPVFSVGMSSGYSFPFGSFGSNDKSKTNSGGASFGAFEDIYLSYRNLIRKFGLSAKIIGQFNVVEADALGDRIASDAYIPTTWESSGDYWQFGAFLYGVNFSVDIAKKNRFEFVGLSGLTILSSPKLKMSSPELFVRADRTSSYPSPMINIGAMFYTQTKHNIQLNINLNYFGAFTFTNMWIESEDTVISRDISQPISCINIGLGLSIDLK